MPVGSTWIGVKRLVWIVPGWTQGDSAQPNSYLISTLAESKAAGLAPVFKMEEGKMLSTKLYVFIPTEEEWANNTS